MYYNDDDFYMVLPSNASPDTHPNNTPGDFIVSWENSIDLDPNYNWKVALTELNYVYSSNTIAAQYLIKYKRVQERSDAKHEFFLYGTYAPSVFHFESGTMNNDPGDEKFVAALTTTGHLEIRSNLPFAMVANPKSAEVGIPYTGESVSSKYLPDVKEWVLTGEESLFDLYHVPVDDIGKRMPEIKFEPMMFVWRTMVEESSYISFKSVKKIMRVQDLVQYIAEQAAHIFDKFEVLHTELDERVSFTAKPNIWQIQLLNGLNLVLGFEDMTFKKNEDFTLANIDKNPISKTAEYIPHLNRGITNMLVYASICRPIHVGHALAPLLKHVHIDAKNDYQVGHSRNYVVHNPMYVPVASMSFSKIEVNIRNDAGVILPFPLGSVTTLTIHFKKNYKQ